MKKFYTIIYITCFVIISFNIKAKEYTVKINYGLVNHDDAASSINNDIKYDNTDSGYIFSLSKNLNQMFDTEFIYYDLGDSTIKGENGEIFTHDGGNYQFKNSGTISRNTSGLGIGGIISTPKSDFNSSAYLKIGFHHWSHSGSTDLLHGSSSTFESHYYNKGFDLYSGLGLDFTIINNVIVSLDYYYISFNDSTFGQIIGTPSTLLSLGLGLKF
tara:strand:- start:694 stop:1338 length:645 start_codon:yes stop_codon:yes gene_type:complete